MPKVQTPNRVRAESARHLGFGVLAFGVSKGFRYLTSAFQRLCCHRSGSQSGTWPDAGPNLEPYDAPRGGQGETVREPRGEHLPLDGKAGRQPAADAARDGGATLGITTNRGTSDGVMCEFSTKGTSDGVMCEFSTR